MFLSTVVQKYIQLSFRNSNLKYRSAEREVGQPQKSPGRETDLSIEYILYCNSRNPESMSWQIRGRSYESMDLNQL